MTRQRNTMKKLPFRDSHAAQNFVINIYFQIFAVLMHDIQSSLDCFTSSLRKHYTTFARLSVVMCSHTSVLSLPPPSKFTAKFMVAGLCELTTAEILESVQEKLRHKLNSCFREYVLINFNYYSINRMFSIRKEKGSDSSTLS
jgi:hypothetical protein